MWRPLFRTAYFSLGCGVDQCWVSLVLKHRAVRHCVIGSSILHSQVGNLEQSLDVMYNFVVLSLVP